MLYELNDVLFLPRPLTPTSFIQGGGRGGAPSLHSRAESAAPDPRHDALHGHPDDRRAVRVDREASTKFRLV